MVGYEVPLQRLMYLKDSPCYVGGSRNLGSWDLSWETDSWVLTEVSWDCMLCTEPHSKWPIPITAHHWHLPCTSHVNNNLCDYRTRFNANKVQKMEVCSSQNSRSITDSGMSRSKVSYVIWTLSLLISNTALSYGAPPSLGFSLIRRTANCFGAMSLWLTMVKAS